MTTEIAACPPTAIKVLIVGGLLTMQEALQRALATVTAVTVIGIGRDLLEAERLLADDQPDVVLLCGDADIATGARMVEHILAAHPDARVVVLALDDDDESLRSFVTAGAFGLVNLQLDGFDALVSALHRAAAGEFLLSPDTLRRIIQYQRTEAVRQKRRADMIKQLTERELEVLALVGCGLDNRTIAEKLYVSVTTVRSHVQHLLAKLGLHSRLQVAVLANQFELAASPPPIPAVRDQPGIRGLGLVPAISTSRTNPERWRKQMRRYRTAAAWLTRLSGVLLIAGSFIAMPVAHAQTGADIWLQTMDSCKQALGSAEYQIVSTNGTNFTVSTPPSSPVSVAGSSGCPLQKGNCVLSGGATPAGCVEFADLQPGTYTIHETATPPAHGTNSEGYAPCTGGSACQQEFVTLVVNSDLTAQAWVTNVYPDGVTVCWPGGKNLPAGTTTTCQQTGVAGYAGTPADPIVTHNFGLAAPGDDSAAPHECDGDNDADDHLTGTPSSHCAYPEAQEGTWCGGDTSAFPFPWSCTLEVQGTPTPTPSTCSSPVTSTFSGSVGADSTVSTFVKTSAAGTLSANVVWTPLNSVNLIIYTDSSKLLTQTGSSTAGNSTATLQNLAAATYKIKVANGGTSSVKYTLNVTHC